MYESLTVRERNMKYKRRLSSKKSIHTLREKRN